MTTETIRKAIKRILETSLPSDISHAKIADIADDISQMIADEFTQ